MSTYAVFDHFHGDQVMAANGDDDIRVFFTGFHIHFMHGLYGRQILIDDRVQGTAALIDIPADTPQDADIGIGVHKNADIHQLPQLGLSQDHDPVDDQDTGRLNGNDLIAAVMDRIVIDRTVDREPLSKQLDMRSHQVGVKSFRRVIILARTFLIGLVMLGFIIIIVIQNGYLSGEPFFQHV